LRGFFGKRKESRTISPPNNGGETPVVKEYGGRCRRSINLETSENDGNLLAIRLFLKIPAEKKRKASRGSELQEGRSEDQSIKRRLFFWILQGGRATTNAIRGAGAWCLASLSPCRGGCSEFHFKEGSATYVSNFQEGGKKGEAPPQKACEDEPLQERMNRSGTKSYTLSKRGGGLISG